MQFTVYRCTSTLFSSVQLVGVGVVSYLTLLPPPPPLPSHPTLGGNIDHRHCHTVHTVCHPDVTQDLRLCPQGYNTDCLSVCL